MEEVQGEDLLEWIGRQFLDQKCFPSKFLDEMGGDCSKTVNCQTENFNFLETQAVEIGASAGVAAGALSCSWYVSFLFSIGSIV